MHNLVHHSKVALNIPEIIPVDYPQHFEGERHREAVLVGARATNKLVEVQLEARTDELTGLSNRRGFDEGLEKLVKIAIEEEKPHLALLFIDLDNFKKVNDNHPDKHAAGDRVLVVVRDILSETIKLRDDEVAGRLGGDEFAVAIRTGKRQNDEHGAETDDINVITGFTLRFKEEVEKLAKQIGIPALGISVGAVMYKKGETVEEFRERADKAMYEMKKSKKNHLIN